MKTINTAEAIVIGDGWAALATVGFLVQKQTSVIWISGTGSRILASLPGLEKGAAVGLWAHLARGFGLETGDAVTGSFLREFRNKAFREPSWTKAPTPETRQEVLNETLWAPERRLVPQWESRFSMTINEIENRIRALLTGDSAEGAEWRNSIRRIESLPVASLKVEDGKVRGVVLASGEELLSDQIYYMDRWSQLPAITGLPKNLPFIRRRDPMSLLQVTFHHVAPMGVGVLEGFFGSVHKESGEEFERHLWGHFSSDGLQSYWSLCLTGDEVEDNHQIAKKLRRMKNALDKMFSGSSWLPEGVTEFMANVSSEQVLFQDSVLFAEGEVPTEPLNLSGLHGITFGTDGYGPSAAIEQVGKILEIQVDASTESALVDLTGPNPQTEGVDLDSPAVS
jgi:hypothetical protein